MTDYNSEYFYMRPGPTNCPPLTLWGIQQNIFWRAEPIQYESLPFVFDSSMTPSNPQMGDAHYLVPGFVVSKRLKEHMEQLDLKDTQLVPATIKDEKGVVHEDYFALHVYNAVRCADLEKSDWVPSVRDPERVQSFDELVLDNAALEAIPLKDRLAIMVEEQKLTHIYHRSFVEHVMKIQPTGMRFYSIDIDCTEFNG